MMKTGQLLMMGSCVGAILFAGCIGPKGDTVPEQKAHTLTMRQDAMADLIKGEPEVKEKLAKAAGYAVFSNLDVNLLVVSAGNGFGVVHDNATGSDVYMKMGTVGVGLGAGIKDFRAVMIFRTKAALESFTEKGWEWGAQADATAVAGDKGAATGAAGDITGDMDVYTITESGISLQATIAGTKYWKDEDLN